MTEKKATGILESEGLFEAKLKETIDQRNANTSYKILVGAGWFKILEYEEEAVGPADAIESR